MPLSHQERLSVREQQDIINELQTMQRIRDCLDVVEIAMSFLATGGQRAEKRMEDYLDTALKMKDRFNSKKVMQCLAKEGSLLAIHVIMYSKFQQ